MGELFLSITVTNLNVMAYNGIPENRLQSGMGPGTFFVTKGFSKNILYYCFRLSGRVGWYIELV